MTSMNEILNRDHRTTLSLPKRIKDSSNKSVLSYEKCSTMFYNCDYCQMKKNSNFFAKPVCYTNIMKLFGYYLALSVSVYIMSSNQTEASPIPSTRPSTAPSGHDEVDKINFLNLRCDASSNDPKKDPITTLSDAQLQIRLKAVVLSCSVALHKTKELTGNYIEQLWGKNTTVNAHANTWENKNIPWLWPESKPLPKKFRSDIQQTHLDELHKINWTREKIFEYLGKIYQRFQRIGVGVQIVNKWNDLASMEGTTLLNTDQVNISTKLFKNATEGIHDVLCEIQGIFRDMAIDPRTDLDITPFILDKFIKLNHWLVYREYENLMDYSHKLIKIITKNKESLG